MVFFFFLLLLDRDFFGLLVIVEVKLDTETFGNTVLPRKYDEGDDDIGFLYIEDSEALTVPKPGYIKAWKLYTRWQYDVTMVVLRPTGKEKTFTYIGGNTVSITPNITNTIVIEGFARIKVEKGDIIGWYYLPQGKNPGLLYVYR